MDLHYSNDGVIGSWVYSKKQQRDLNKIAFVEWDTMRDGFKAQIAVSWAYHRSFAEVG